MYLYFFLICKMKRIVRSPEPDLPSIRRKPRLDVNEKRHNMMKEFFSHFGIDYSLVSQYLRETTSVIAGSSVLQVFIGEFFKDADLDIYVPVQHINVWKENLLQMGYEERSAYYSTPYKQSFLFQNGIKQVVTFKHPKIEDKHRNIQLMSVRKKTNPVEVIKTFDLSFCQCWYDGSSFYANDPDVASTKSGYLAYNYAEKLFDGSWIMTKRVTKYHNRGFIIKVPENFPIQMDIKKLVEMGQQLFQQNRDRDGSRLGDYAGQYYRKYYEMVTKFFSTPELMKQWLNKFIFHFALGIEPKLSMQKKYGTGRLFIYDREATEESLYPITFPQLVPNSENYDSDDEEDFANVASNVDISHVAYYSQFLRMDALRIALREIYKVQPERIVDFETTDDIKSSLYPFEGETEFLDSLERSDRYKIIDLDNLFGIYKLLRGRVRGNYDDQDYHGAIINDVENTPMFRKHKKEIEYLFKIFRSRKELDEAADQEEEITQLVGKIGSDFPVICHQEFPKYEEINVEPYKPDLPDVDTPLLNSMRQSYGAGSDYDYEDHKKVRMGMIGIVPPIVHLPDFGKLNTLPAIRVMPPRRTEEGANYEEDLRDLEELEQKVLPDWLLRNKLKWYADSPSDAVLR